VTVLFSSLTTQDLMQKNRTFSRRGVEDRGDTSAWTADPTAKGERPKTTLQMAKEMAMANITKRRDEESAAAVKEHNEKFRNESLLNLHLSTLKDDDKEEKFKKENRSSSDSDDSSNDNKKHRHEKKNSKSKSKKKRKREEKKDKAAKKKRKKEEDTEETKKPEETKKQEYVPFFDRERDLVSPQVDSKKRNEMISRSTQLNSRFSSGSSGSSGSSTFL